MNTINGTLRARDGTSLYWKAWLPEGTPRAVVHLIHGYAEHIDRYGNVVNELVPAGYAVFGNDHRGHGRSAGRPQSSHSPSWRWSRTTCGSGSSSSR